jgi:hypothetical protein
LAGERFSSRPTKELGIEMPMTTYSVDEEERLGQIAFKMREYYERNREPFWKRFIIPFPNPDNLMLGLLRIALMEASVAAKQDYERGEKAWLEGKVNQ